MTRRRWMVALCVVLIAVFAIRQHRSRRAFDVTGPNYCANLDPNVNWFLWWYYNCGAPAAGGGGSGAS